MLLIILKSASVHVNGPALDWSGFSNRGARMCVTVCSALPQKTMLSASAVVSVLDVLAGNNQYM